MPTTYNKIKHVHPTYIKILYVYGILYYKKLHVHGNYIKLLLVLTLKSYMNNSEVDSKG